MSLIVAARFQTFPEAENAARSLFAKGFSEDAVHMFFVNPAGAHDRYPVGGDRTSDPDSKGAQYSAVTGAVIIGLIGAVVGGVLVFLFGQSGYAAVGAAAVGAYVGSLAGALWAAGKGRKTGRKEHGKPAEVSHPAVRHAGVLLAVHVQPDTEQQVADLLRAAGGLDVERARGRWQDGHWQDFDPVQPPDPVRPS